MKRKKMLNAASFLLLGVGLFAASCAKEYSVNDTKIDTAVKMEVQDITATGATVSLSPTKDVAGYILAGPVPASEYKFDEHDAIANLAWIQEHGKESAFPLKEQTISPLNAGTEYLCGWIAKNADGDICSAPAFRTFTTGTAKATVDVSVATPGTFTFNYSVFFNGNTESVKWIVTTDKTVTSLDGDKLKTYVDNNGETSKDEIYGTITSDVKADCIVAAIAFDRLNRPGEFSYKLFSSETLVKVNVGSASTKLTAVAEGEELFKGTVDIPASGTFTISINGEEYGFVDYSGNGGVGTVNNKKAAMPFYAMTDKMTYKFYVEKAFGQMAPVKEGGNPFWINMGAAGKLDVTVDLTNTDNIFRYRFEVPATDASIVFYEGFDLSVWGGFYQAPVAGSKPNSGGVTTYDGSEPCTASGATTTGMGIDNFCYPSTVDLSGSEAHISEDLMKNWGLEEWTFKKGYLSAGHMRVCASAANCFSYVLTPKFKRLTAATDLTFTMECWNFAAEYKGDLHFDVVGGGKFGTAKVTNTAGYDKTFTVNGTQFVPTTDMIPKHANAENNKTIAKFVFTIEGATSETQLRFGTDEVLIDNTKDSRICIDYIKVTK